MSPEPHHQEVALARFATIAALVSRPMNAAEIARARAAVLAMTHPFPGGERRLSRRTLNRWLNAYRAALPDGPVAALNALVPQEREDKGRPRVFKEADLEEAIRLRRELTARSTALLVQHLGEDAPKEATLAYHLRKRGATRKAIEGRGGRAYPRYEAPAVNKTWQSDVKDGLSLPDPLDPSRWKEVHLIGFIDDHSRLVTHGEWYFKESLPCLFDCFKKAVIKHGRPDQVYWDNGPIYRSKQMKLVAARLGTKVIHATEYHPEGKGKIERFWLTVADGFILEAQHAGIQTLDELNRFFWGWLDGYNQRQHRTTGKAPADRWAAGAEQVVRPEIAVLAEAFLWTDTRLVKKTGAFSLAGNEYQVEDETLVGQSIEVRYDPLDLATMRIYRDSKFVGLAAPAVLAAHTHRKATPRRDDDKYLPLPSSKRLLLARAGAREDAAAADLATLRPPTPPNWLHVGDFQDLLAQVLGRELAAPERESAHRFVDRHPPMRGEGVQQFLDDVVERFGAERHLSFYLGELKALVKAVRP
jgi:transposase InsO family protein